MKKLILTFLILTLITTPLFAGGNRWTSKPPLGSTIDWSHPLSKGLVGCWLMNEGGGLRLNDISGKINTGVFTNPPIWTVGKTGKCLNFNGTSNYITLPDVESLQMGTKNFTFEAWVYPTNFGSWSSFIGAEAQGASFGCANGVLKVTKVDSVDAPDSGVTLPLNKWSHCAVTFNNILTTSNLKYYYNGNLVATVDFNVDFTAGRASNLLGLRLAGGLHYFYGKMDIVRIWNRALSPQEIRTLYQDPYCFINPPTVWSKFKTAVAGYLGWVTVINN